MRLMLVEDDARLAAFLAQGLTEAGFAVDVFGELADAEAALRTTPYDLLILDLGMPDGDGVDFLATLRQRREMLPILVLTARGALADRVEGLNRGADDYVIKPCATEELVARAKALLRRPGGALGAQLELGNLRFDTVAMECGVDGAPLDLARRELAVLETLLRRAGRVVPKRVLEDKVYGFDDQVASNSIEVHISRLRRKLEAAGATVQVHTLRGIGYLLSEVK